MQGILHESMNKAAHQSNVKIFTVKEGG